jgi:hypothetical protein
MVLLVMEWVLVMRKVSGVPSYTELSLKVAFFTLLPTVSIQWVSR